MAEVQAPAAPSQMEASAEIVSGATAAASEVDPEPETQAGSVAKKETAKENVPPKRAPGLTTAKRPGTGSTSSATKPTASSTSSAAKSLGGLSKPPTRPTAGSAVRKPASGATAPTSASSGHKSQASVGGSGDEKKKPLAAAPKRTSLAPAGTHQSPAKTETLAERRGVPATTSSVRKPAASISSSPKSSVKPAATSSTIRATGGTSTTASRSTPTPKPAAAVSGTVADVKKRLSTIAASPGTARASTTRPTHHATSASTSTKEIDELKAKLADSETRVEELKKEITSSQEKLLELGKQLEEEARRVATAEENIRTEHAEIVEKLHATHSAIANALQAKLDESEVTQKAAEEASLKAIEEARQVATAKGASDTAAAIEKLKADHESVLSAINSELATTKQASAAAFSDVSQKEGEIASLRSLIDEAKMEVTKLKSEFEAMLASHLEEHKVSLSDLKKTLAAEHETALSALKDAHSADIAEGNAAAVSAHEKQVAHLSAQHETSTKTLQKRLEEAIAASAALEASHKKKSEAQEADSSATISKLTKEIGDSRAKSESTQQQLAIAQDDLIAVTKKHALSKSKIEELERVVNDTKTKLAEKENNLKTVETKLVKDGNVRDELLAKAKADFAATHKSLEEKTKEISTLNEKHRKELETISNDYQAEIDSLQGNTEVKDELEALKAKHIELTKAHDIATKKHANDLEKVKQDYAAVTVALDNAKSDHLKALEQLKATHAKNLDEAHDKAITAGDAAHAAELEQLQSNHSNVIAALKKEHAKSLASATAGSEKHKTVETSLQSEIQKTSQSLIQAQKELGELKEQFAIEKMARATAEAELDAARSKKPDTSEADALRKELQSLKDQHQTALSAIQKESAKATEDHLSVKSTLEKTQAALEKEKAATAIKLKTSEADYKDMHDSMTQLVEEANKKAADAAARLKEAEANLNVKDAELVEAKAKNTAPPQTPTKSKGLAASRFAEPVDEPEAKTVAAEGEQDSSSAALASLAKASLTVQQLDQMNEDLKKDNLRSLESITDVAPSLAV